MRRHLTAALAAPALLTALFVGPVVYAQTGPPGPQAPGGMMGRGGMMGQRDMANLKELPPERAVQAVRYCKGRYLVSTAAGDALEFSEFNLRIKSDSSDKGPHQGKPALLPAAMMGDRAFLIFSDPAEISSYIEKKCEGG
jgi:cytochrome c